jgi:hypothetical protein
MKMVKSLILGSAAGLVAMSGAQAADLPVKAKAVEYVRVCSLYGAGFYYIPGTDTCIKIGGYLRVETAFNTNAQYNGNLGGVAGAKNRLSNYYTSRSREDLNFDTRTATEYGVVRTFFNATFSWTTGGYAGAGTGLTGGATAYDGAPAGTNGNGSVAGGSLGVYNAFIQFAGFTLGKAVSQFSAPWTNYPANNFDGLVGGGGTVTAVNQFTYTYEFGNGVSAALSAQDQVAYYHGGVYNVSGATALGILGGSYGLNDIGGTRAPDIVGMVRVDQAWGLFQASGAAHLNTAGYYGAFETSGSPGNEWGWAGQVALSIKNIPTGPGDTINMQAVYTDGATRYNIQDLAPNSISAYGGTGVLGAYQSVGFGLAPDSVFVAGGQLEKVKTWGFRGGYTHNWSPHWNTGIYGAYAQVSYTDAAKSFICGSTGMVALLRAGSTCNPDVNVAQAGIITRWIPVKNLTFSSEFTWVRLDQQYAGTVNHPGNAVVAKPIGVYALSDQDSYTFHLRAQRNF